jgi:hypothetical protein
MVFPYSTFSTLRLEILEVEMVPGTETENIENTVVLVS